MSKKTKTKSSRISNDLYRGTTDFTNGDFRYKVKKCKSRKERRKLERKNAKKMKHERFLKGRKNKNVKVEVKSSKIGEENGGKKLKSILKSGLNVDTKKDLKVRFDDVKEIPKDPEVEYFEQKLMKGKGGKKIEKSELLKELKSEFLNLGFDEDFYYFVNNITRIGDTEKVLNDDYSEDDMEQDHVLDDQDENDDLDIDSEQDYQSQDDDHEKEDGVNDTDELEVDESEEVSVEDVKRKQTGLVNRLSEGNYNIILNQLLDLYSKMIKDANESDFSEKLRGCFDNLCDLIIKMIVDEVNVVISLVATQSALICSLSNHFNSSILKLFLSKLFKMIETHLKELTKSNDKGSDKQVLRNILISICSLYYYQHIDIDIIFHLIKLLTNDDINEDILQLLLILLKYSGYDVNQNVDILNHLNDVITRYKETNPNFSNRVKYIEEELNSSKKGKNVFDQFEYLRNMIKSSITINNVVVNFEQLLDSSSDHTADVHESFESIKLVKRKDNFKDELVKKANKIGLNKDIQKTIFVCIMNAISPENALDNILQIKLTNQQHNDVINIVIHCFLIEKEYNHYYVKLLLLLTSRLSSAVCKRYKKAINNTMVLYFKNFEQLNKKQFPLLAKLFYQMIINKIVQLRLLNFINISHYTTNYFQLFSKQLFAEIITSNVEDELEEYLIQQLLSIKTEEYFSQLTLAWNNYLQAHCLELVNETNCSNILFKSFQHIFNENS